MKIALCFSGQPRSVNDMFPQFEKYLLSKYDVDVFVHSWFDRSYNGIPFDYSIQYQRHEKWNAESDDIIKNLYKPKKYLFEPQINFDMSIFKNADFQKQKPFVLKSMWYSIKKSNELKCEYEKSNNFTYDCVIRCRFDTVFKSFNLDLNKEDMNKIHISGEIQPLCNDQFAFSSSENMNYYTSLYDNLEKYHLEDKLSVMVNEHVLTYHLRNTPKFFHDEKNMLISIKVKT